VINEPGQFDTSVEMGCAYEKTFIVTIAGVPFNFTGYNMVGAIKARPEDVLELLALSKAAGHFTGDSTGHLTVAIPKASIETLSVKKLSWSMRLIQPDLRPFPLLAGVFEVTPRRVNG
jgi:hypothetical protein